MAFNDNSDFDRTRRILYYTTKPLPERIGAVKLDGIGNRPCLQPYSQIIDPDEVVYYETNPFYPKWASNDDLADIYFNEPTWGEVESIQYNSSVEVNDTPVPDGQTRQSPEQIVIHRFDRL